MSVFNSISSYFRVPDSNNSNEAFIKQITRQSLRQIFKIDENVCEDILRFEGDFEPIRDEAEQMLKIYNETKERNRIAKGTDENRKVKHNVENLLLCSTHSLTGTLVAAACAKASNYPVQPTAFVVGVILMAVASCYFLPTFESTVKLEELPELGLQARKIRNWIEIKLKYVNEQLIKFDNQSRTLALSERYNTEGIKIRENFNQLIAAKTYFDTART